MSETRQLHLPGVSKTAILTLRARAEEHLRDDRYFADPAAVEWFKVFEWPSELDPWYSARLQGFLAYRAYEIDQLVMDFASRMTSRIASRKRRAQVIELGCGLSSRHLRIPASVEVDWIHLDLPDVISARHHLQALEHQAHDDDRQDQLFDEGRGRQPSVGRAGKDASAAKEPAAKDLPSSVLDFEWMHAIDPDEPSSTLFIAEGLLYYLPKSAVQELIDRLRLRFPRAGLVFDVVGRVEFDWTLKHSTHAGAPIQWMMPPPFEAAATHLGLEILPGWSPEILLERALARCWRRFGPLTYWTARTLTLVPPLRNLRSGIVAARLPATGG